MPYDYFNTPKVRLEDQGGTLGATPSNHFNTPKVRLEARVVHEAWNQLPYFNTPKVRLEGPSHRVNKVPLRGAAGRFVGPSSIFNIVIPRFCVNPGRVTTFCR